MLNIIAVESVINRREVHAGASNIAGDCGGSHDHLDRGGSDARTSIRQRPIAEVGDGSIERTVYIQAAVLDHSYIRRRCGPAKVNGYRVAVWRATDIVAHEVFRVVDHLAQ